MEARKQQIKDLKAMLDTGLVSDPEIIEETKTTIAELEAEVAKEEEQKEEKPVASVQAKTAAPKKIRKPNSKDFAHSWKKTTAIKGLEPIVIHCQHYHLKVKEEMYVGIKGAGNNTQKVKARPGEHLIFDDTGRLVYIMNANSFAQKCNEKSTVQQHKKEHHHAEKAPLSIVTKTDTKRESNTKPKAKASNKSDRQSPYAILEAEIKDVVKILDQPKISKSDAEKLPQELKDIEKRAKSTAKKSTIAYIEQKAKKIQEGKKLSRSEVIKLALAAQPLIRTGKSVVLDTLFANKKRLEPTVDGLLRWLKSPSRYDLIGVDVSDEVKPTVKPKRPKQDLLSILNLK